MFKEIKKLWGIWFGNIGCSKYHGDPEYPWDKYKHLIELIDREITLTSSAATVDKIKQVCEILKTTLKWDDCDVVGQSLATLYVYCGNDKDKQEVLVGILSYYKPVGVGIQPLNYLHLGG